MGYTRSPIIWHSTLMPVLRYLRRRGILLTIFCDDGLGVNNKGRDECVMDAKIVKWVC